MQDIIAYIIVLISVGLSGMFLIKSANDTLWNMQMEQADVDAKYAADSFLALTDILYGEISERQISNIVNQIKSSINSSVIDIKIYTTKTAEKEFLNLSDNEGISRFVKENNLL